METKMVSNLLVSMISKQFTLKNFYRQYIKTFDRKSRGLSDSKELLLPIGIWDDCKLNPSYKELVELLQIHEFSYNKALKMFFNSILILLEENEFIMKQNTLKIQKKTQVMNIISQHLNKMRK